MSVEPLHRVIEDLPGFAPEIGKLLVMMTHVRQTTLHAVQALTPAHLDHLHDAQSNTIGGLLAHVAAVEATYQISTFEARELTAEDRSRWGVALKLGEPARRDIRNQPLSHYIVVLEEVRARTVEEFARHDDDWLCQRREWKDSFYNNYFLWFHVFQDELRHLGQIRWLRKRLPGAAPVTG